MRCPRFVVVLSLAGLLALPVAQRAVRAQDATPGASSGTHVAANDESQRAMHAYLNTLFTGGDFGKYLADDVTLTDEDSGQVVQGRQQVVDAIVALHQTTFAAKPQLTGLVIGRDSASAELLFVATQSAEFAGVPSAGASVRVPYAAFYDLADGKVTAIRLYGLTSGLVRQLTAPATPVASPTA